MNASLLFLRNEARAWRSKRAQLLISCALLGLLLALVLNTFSAGNEILRDRPHWVSNDFRLYTLHSQHQVLGYRGVSREFVREIQSLAAVEDVSLISFRDVTFRTAEGKQRTLRAAFVSEGIEKFFTSSVAQRFSVPSLNEAFLSSSAYQDLFGQDFEAEKFIFHRDGAIPFGLRVAGRLPRAVTNISSLPVDVLLNVNADQYFTPFSTQGASPNQIRLRNSYLEQVPQYIAIASTRSSVSDGEFEVAFENVINEMSLRPSSSGHIRFSDDGFIPSLLRGFIIEPEKKQSLRARWLALAFLTTFVLITFFLNIFSIFLNDSLSRSRELWLLGALGAGARSFLVLAMSFVLPLVVLSGIFFFPMHYLISESLKSLLPGLSGVDRAIEVVFLPIAILLIVLIVLCVLRSLGFFLSTFKAQFDRQVGSAQVWLMTRFAKVVVSAQVAFICISLVLVSIVSLEQLRSLTIPYVAKDVIEIPIASNAGYRLPAEIVTLNIPGIPSSDVALSSVRFGGSGLEVEARFAGSSKVFPANLRFVSSSYFNIVTPSLVLPHLPDGFSALIVSDTVKELEDGVIGWSEDSIEKSLVLSGVRSEPTAIQAFIQELPHLGTSQSNLAFLYLPYDESLPQEKVSIYVRGNAQNRSEYLLNWIDQRQEIELAGEVQSLGEIIRNQEAGKAEIRLALIVVAVIVLCGALSGFIYQSSVLFELSAVEFTVYRVLGASYLAVVATASKKLLGSVLAGFCLALIAHYSASIFLSNAIPAELFRAEFYALAGAVLTIVVISVSVIYTKAHFGKEIFQMVRRA